MGLGIQPGNCPPTYGLLLVVHASRTEAVHTALNGSSDWASLPGTHDCSALKQLDFIISVPISRKGSLRGLSAVSQESYTSPIGLNKDKEIEVLRDEAVLGLR